MTNSLGTLPIGKHFTQVSGHVSLTIALLLGLCSMQQEVHAQEEIHISDLRVSFTLSSNWKLHQEPLRAFQVERRTSAPAWLRPFVKVDDAGALDTGLNIYSYHNLEDSVAVAAMDVFYYDLHIVMHSYYDKKQRRLWAEGKCKPDFYCYERMSNHVLIRKLDEAELPFDADVGFLHELLREGEDVPRILVYSYYVVKDNLSYRVLFSMADTDEERKKQVESEAFAVMLPSIKLGE